jgi:PAS domain S-box-containing protein
MINYRKLIDSIIFTADSIVVLLDKDARIIIFNNFAEKITGYSFEDVYKRNWFDVFLPEKEKGRLSGVFENVISKNDFPENIINTIVTKDGRELCVDWRNSCILADDSDENYVLSIGLDVTEKIQLQESLQERNSQLEQLNSKLEERISGEVNLRLAQEKALLDLARFTGIGELVNALAHQWRQPLTAVSITLQEITELLGTDVQNLKEITENIDTAVGQLFYLSETIDNFRNFFKPSDVEELFSLTEVLAEIFFIFSPGTYREKADFYFNGILCNGHNRDNGKSYALGLKHLDKEYCVYGFRSHFKQVLTGIIQNSLDSIDRKMARGSDFGGKIEIGLFDDCGETVIFVKDNGEGIAPENLSKIFQPYFTTKHMARGTGLGLYVSRMIVEKYMHGSLTVTNGDDEGAMIEIRLGKVEDGEYICSNR